MSKAVLNQRYIYKINSSLIKRNKSKVKMNNISKDFKNRYIVGIGDSMGTRMIRDITNSPYNEEYINNIKDQIEVHKKIKSKDTTEKKKIKLTMKKLIEEKLRASLEINLCSVVFDNGDYDYLAENGFMINDIEYTLLLGTSGGVKQNSVLFINKEIYEEVMRRIKNGYDESIEMLDSKLMAYMSLVFSSSTPVTNTERILVVKDVQTKFKDDITYIKFNEEKGRPDVDDIFDTEVEINACDGCGMIYSSNEEHTLADDWDECLGLDYKATAYCIRHSFCKGILSRFNFRKYVKEVLKTTKVKDKWDIEHNIDDIDIIMNESMFKLHKAYNNLESFLVNCRENKYTFSVTKATPKLLEDTRRLNYQYIQCLNLNDKDIENILRDDINEIKDVLGLDYRKSILFSKGTELNDSSVWLENARDDLYAKVLMIDGANAIKDDYIKYKIKRAISKRIDQLKTGKINVEGNYQIAIGEPIIQLQAMCGIEEPQGLLNKGEFYIEYWREKGVSEVGGFRSPMSCKSNARRMKICNREEIIKWYGDLKNIIVFNAKDTSMMAFNGEDFDGDINFTTSNGIIINGIYDLPAIVCENAKSTPKSFVTKQDFINCIKKSFGNKVGSVTNFGSSCYDKLSLFEEDSEEYKEIDYRIKCTQFYQQECIDSVKNGKPPKPIPSYWHDYNDKKLKYNIDESTGEILNSEKEIKEIELYKKVLTEKKPYYFIYIYDYLMKEYNDFIKNTETNCARRFRCKINELQPDTEEKEEFLKWYDKKLLVSNNPCIVNKIAKIVENELPRRDRVYNEEFDFNIYLDKEKEYEIATPSEIKRIKESYDNYKNMKKSGTLMDYIDKDEFLKEGQEKNSNLKEEIFTIVPNKDTLIRTMLNLAYEKSVISKSFVWDTIGDLIVKNMLKNNSYIIKYPQKNVKGNMLYGRNRFSMTEKNLK